MDNIISETRKPISRPRPKFAVGSWVCPSADRPKALARVMQIVSRRYDEELGLWLYSTESGIDECEFNFRKASPSQLWRESRRQRGMTPQ